VTAGLPRTRAPSRGRVPEVPSSRFCRRRTGGLGDRLRAAIDPSRGLRLSTTAVPEPARSSRFPRAVTYGLCGGLLLLGIGQVELWPMSAFRLFSGVRGPEATSWVVTTVDAGGDEHRVDLAALGGRVGLPHHVLPSLVDASPAERRAVLEAYVEAAGSTGGEVRARVYRVVSRISTEPEVPSTELSRDLVYEVVLP
jgi:hypothetical protein